MSQSRMIGVVLLVIGVGAFIVGMNASNSFADQTSNTFTGHFTNATAWYIVGGGAAALLGLLMTVSGGRGKRA